MTHQQQTAFENIVGKGEIARNEQFLLFPQCFQLLSDNCIPICPYFLTSYLYLLLNWKSLKLAYQVKGYTEQSQFHAVDMVEILMLDMILVCVYFTHIDG